MPAPKIAIRIRGRGFALGYLGCMAPPTIEPAPDDSPAEWPPTGIGRALVWMLDRMGEPAELVSPAITRDPMLDPTECVVCGRAEPRRVLRVERPAEKRWWSAFVPGSFGRRLLLPVCGGCAARAWWGRVIGTVWFFVAFGAGLALHAWLRWAGLHALLSLALATVVAFFLMPWGWVLFSPPVSFERGPEGERLECTTAAVRDRVARAIGHAVVDEPGPDETPAEEG